MVRLGFITMLSTAHVPLSLLVQGILPLRTLEFHQGGSGIRQGAAQGRGFSWLIAAQFYSVQAK